MTLAELEKIFTFEPLNAERRMAIRIVFAGAYHFARLLYRELPESREKELAITALQESLKWADTAIAIQGRPAGVTKASGT